MAFLEHQLIEEIPALRRYARTLTRDRESADDLVQDCLERAWKNIGTLKPDSHLRAWLFTIMRNLFFNERRRQKRSPLVAGMDDVDEMNSCPGGPEVPVQIEELEKFLMNLSDDQREIITLVAIEGMAYRDVAAILDVPVGTVMSRLHRARETLRVRVFGMDSSQLVGQVK